MKWHSKTVPFVAAAALATATVGTATVFADTSGSPAARLAASQARQHLQATQSTVPGHVRFGGHGLATAVANLLGMDAGTLKADLQSGQTLADIAQSKGISEPSLIAGLEAAVKQRLDQAVQAGRLTTQQEQTAVQWFDSHVQQWVESKLPVRAADRVPARREPRVWLLKSVATILGADAQTLLQDIRNGQTIAQIAQSKGVSVDTLASQLASQLKLKLDQAVQSGKLSASQEQQMLTHLQQSLTKWLSQPWRPGDARKPFRVPMKAGWGRSGRIGGGSAQANPANPSAGSTASGAGSSL